MSSTHNHCFSHHHYQAWCHQIFFVNNTKIFVTSSVLKLQKWFLHQNGVESNQESKSDMYKLLGGAWRCVSYQKMCSRWLLAWYRHLAWLDIVAHCALHDLTLSCRWVDISTWTPPPQDCLYLGPSPSVVDNSFFAESLWTSYNFLASLQIIFNWENAQSKFLDKFLSIIYSRQERVKLPLLTYSDHKVTFTNPKLINNMTWS